MSQSKDEPNASDDDDDLELSLDEDEDETVEIDNNDEDKNKSTKRKKWHGQEEFLKTLHSALTISKSKIKIITKMSMKNRVRYKDIVHHIEKFIRKGKTANETKLPQLFIIDSILRADIKENGNKASHSKFVRRFGKNIDKTFHALCRGPSSDKAAIAKTFNIWIQEKWFDSAKMDGIAETIQAFAFEKKKEKSHKKQSPSSHHKKKHKRKEKRRKHSKSKDVVENGGLLESLQSLTAKDGVDKALDPLQGGHLKRKLMEDDARMAKRMKREMPLPQNGNGNGVYPAHPNAQVAVPSAPHHAAPSASTTSTAPMMQQSHGAMHPYHQMAPNQHMQRYPAQSMPAAHQMMNGYNMQSAVPSAAHHYNVQPYAPHQPPHHQQQPPLPSHHHPHPHAAHAAMSGAIGYEMSDNQSNVMPDRHRALSCTIYVGFWNDVHVDIEKLREEGGQFGPVLKIMPHPTKPPHKHAFVQFETREQAENAKAGLRKRFNQLQFVQKVGWGRPPKLIKETFKFDTGIGEVLKIDDQRAQRLAMHMNEHRDNHPPNPNGHRAAYANVNTPQQPMASAYAPAVYGQHQYHQYAQSYPQQQVQPQPQTYNRPAYNQKM